MLAYKLINRIHVKSDGNHNQLQLSWSNSWAIKYSFRIKLETCKSENKFLWYLLIYTESNLPLLITCQYQINQGLILGIPCVGKLKSIRHLNILLLCLNDFLINPRISNKQHRLAIRYRMNQRRTSTKELRDYASSFRKNLTYKLYEYTYKICNNIYVSSKCHSIYVLSLLKIRNKKNNLKWKS